MQIIAELAIKPARAKNEPRVLGLAILANKVIANKKQLGLKLKQITYDNIKIQCSGPYYFLPSIIVGSSLL